MHTLPNDLFGRRKWDKRTSPGMDAAYVHSLSPLAPDGAAVYLSHAINNWMRHKKQIQPWEGKCRDEK